MATVIQLDQTLSFKGHLRIDNISETLQCLRDLQLSAPLTLNFSEVTQVDTAAISLILEIQRQLHAQASHGTHDHSLQVVGVPDNLRSLMQLYGVDGFLLQ